MVTIIRSRAAASTNDRLNIKPALSGRRWLLCRTGAITSLVLTTAMPLAWADSAAVSTAQQRYDAAVKARSDMQLDLRLQNSRNVGYDRQAEYWRSLDNFNRQNVRLQELRLQAARAESEGKTLPAAEQAELARLVELVDRPGVGTEARQAAIAKWTNVQQTLDKLAPQHSRHLVNISILRDFNQRGRRIKFYVQEALRPAEGGYGGAPLPAGEQAQRMARALKPGANAPDLGRIPSPDGFYRGDFWLALELDELVRDTRKWTEEYGDIFFSRLGQSNQYQFESAEALAKRASALEPEFEALEKRRLALTEKVVAFLAPFDRDGKFGTVAPPSNQRPTLDAQGRPSDLMLVVDPGLGGLSDVLKPLGFNVVNFLFYPPAFKANGEVDTNNAQWTRRDTTIGADVNAGLGVSQPLSVLIHGSTLLGGTEQWDKDPAKSFFLKNDKGESATYPNIWNKQIREEFGKRLRSVGMNMKTKPNFMFYDKLTWEPAFKAGDHEGTPLRAGYNPEAITAFRDFLRQKFGTIEKLNTAWRSKYASFDQIDPPRDPALAPRTWATPLSYEFEVFRQNSYADWLRFCVENLQAADPGRPVAVEVTSLNLNAHQAVSSPYQILKHLPSAYVEDHQNNWSISYPTLKSLYSVARYTGKIPIEMEYIWTYPRLQHPVSESDFRVTGELGLWRRIVWGRKALQPFGTYDGWGYRHGMTEERFAELGPTLGTPGTLLREAATSLAVGKARATEFWPILSKTEVTKPRIAVIVPSTSVMNEYPTHSPNAALPTVATELSNYERVLTTAQMDFEFVPEEVLTSGEEKLSNFKVVILPYAPYFPAKLGDRLQAWVQQGGTLVSSGVPGVRDAYGFTQDGFVKAVFGSGFRYKYTGDDTIWKWSAEFAGASRKRTTTLSSANGENTLFRTSSGKGAVLLSTVPLDTVAGRRLRVDTLRSEIERAAGGSLAVSDRASYEMVTREDSSGQRYLFITNPALEQPKTDFVTVEGEYRRIIDLGIGSECEIPLASRTLKKIDSRHNTTSYHTDGTSIIPMQSPQGHTTFQMRLAPGEATVLKLER